jgi:D-galactarolactone cycloisomerase
VKVVRVDAYPVAFEADETYLGRLPDGHPPPVGRYFLRPPWRSLYSARYESLLVRVECDSGDHGWGEALAPVAPDVPATIVEHLLAPAVLGADPRQTLVLRRRLTDLMRERGHLSGHQGDALAAMDIALWDLKGRLLDEPVARLLGGPFTERVPVYVSGLPKADDVGRAELARQRAAEGATAIKLALGYGVDADLATYDAVATAVPQVRIAVDAHWVYDLADALGLGRGLDERGAWFLEAPLVPEDVKGHQELAASLDTPVAIGEALRNRFEFREFIDARAVDLCQPDVGRTGITEGLAIWDYAEAHHLAVAPHHSTGLGVALAAGLHLAAARSSLCAFECQPGTLPVANRILRKPITGGSAHLDLPSGPGLGVEVNRDVLDSVPRSVVS